MNLVWLFLTKLRPYFLKGFGFFIIGIGIIAILAQFTDFPKVLALIAAVPGKINLLIFGFLALYYFLKFTVERLLISKLNLAVTTQRIALLFAVAEMSREFPAVPLLAGMIAATRQGEKFFPLKLFSALISQLPLELASCFLILALFGFGNLPFLRLAAFLIFILIFGLLMLLKAVPIPKFLRVAKGGLAQKAAKALLSLKEGLVQLLSWQTLALAFSLVFVYMLSLATVFYLVATAAGFEDLNLTGAWSASALIYIALIFSPLPADWGVSESSGFVLLSFLGSNTEAALASMLTFRIIFSSVTYLLILAIFWFLWDEIKKFLAGFASSSKVI